MKFSLPIPPSINRTYGVSGSFKDTRFYKKAIATDWEKEAGWLLKTQIQKNGYKRKLPFLGDIRVEITYYYSRNRDWDAGNKILCDLLEHGGVYKNDMQIVEAQVKKFSDPGNARVEVEVAEIK